jgi:hypothetical protein
MGPPLEYGITYDVNHRPTKLTLQDGTTITSVESRDAEGKNMVITLYITRNNLVTGQSHEVIIHVTDAVDYDNLITYLATIFYNPRLLL